MFLRVILVRHGQSENNALVEGEGGWAAYYARRRPDAALTPRGERQAAALAALATRSAPRAVLAAVQPLARQPADECVQGPDDPADHERAAEHDEH